MEAKGARLAIVGNGSPAQAGHFADTHGLSDIVFTDPARYSYRALQLKDGLRHTLRWAVLSNAARAYRSGFRQSRVQGDPWQQGGTAVFDETGTLRYLFVSGTAGDHAPLADVLAAVDRIRARQ